MACSAKVLEALELDCESLAKFCLYNLRSMAQGPRISSFERVRARALRVHAVGRQVDLDSGLHKTPEKWDSDGFEPGPHTIQPMLSSVRDLKP